jgi:hypothetical protein
LNVRFSRHHLLLIAAQEWPAARDSGDIARLKRFETAFAGTFFAGEAQALREAIETELILLEQGEAKKANGERRRGSYVKPHHLPHMPGLS